MQNEHDSNPPVPRVDDDDANNSLGHPIQVFRVNPRCLPVLGTALFSSTLVGLGIFAAVLPVVLPQVGELLGDYVPSLVISLGMLGLAWAYLVWRSAFLVCPDGVIKVELWKKELCRWDEVSEIVEIKHPWWSSLGGWVLAKKDGSRMKLIDRRIIDGFATMIGLIREKTASRGISWKDEQALK